MKKTILLSLLLATASMTPAQKQNYKEIELGDNQNYISSIELAPDGKTLAIGTGQGVVLFWDIASQKIIRKVSLNGFPFGPYMNYSSDGQYLLLLEQYFTDWSLNKDRPSRAAVLDVASGNILINKDNVHTAALTPDNQSLVTLQGSEIIFLNILSGAEEKKFKPDNVTNAFAISSDMIVVAQKPTEDDLKNIASVRNDKKAIKEALKFREVAVFYDAKTFTRKYMADDIFDIIFSMKFSNGGNSLYLFNAPNIKFRANSGAARNGYIQSVDPANGSVSRVIFPTSATEPIYKESGDGKFFATTSIEQKFRVINSVAVFDRISGAGFKVFLNDFRLMENIHIGRASFEFLPDHKTIALGYGNKLALWSFEE